MKNFLCLTAVLLYAIATYAQECNLNDNAQRYWARANAAKGNAEYLDAVEEYKKALGYAPDCADIYFNIGECYDKSAAAGLIKDQKAYSEAMKYYKKYLELKPNAANKKALQNKIYELEYKAEKVNKQLPEMVLVEGGTFTMGCTDNDGRDCEEDEKPAHRVTISSFYIGKYEVTQGLWKAVMGTTIRQQRDKADVNWPIKGEGDNFPMYYVSWNEVQDFITRLNAATGKNYRLPTEAEWEFACRGGVRSSYFKYSGSNTVDAVGWYDGNSGGVTHAVGTKAPNELGIYDMSGNVWEWCSDWYDKSYYGYSPPVNPKGPSSGTFRVLRGGGWGSNYRPMYRNNFSPAQRSNRYGFRLAASL